MTNSKAIEHLAEITWPRQQTPEHWRGVSWQLFGMSRLCTWAGDEAGGELAMFLSDLAAARAEVAL